MNIITKTLLLIVAACTITACDLRSDRDIDLTDKEQKKEAGALIAEANRQVGMPNLTEFTERKFAKRMLEMRDDPTLETWVYIVSLDGELIFVTKAIGYGLPYSTQYTNPERYNYNGSNLPQPEPNGLFIPDGLSATWIMAVDKDGNTQPIYMEPEIVVSPFPLK